MKVKPESANRAEIIKWLHDVQGGALSAEADTQRFARRLINALSALDEGRTDPLLKPEKRSNSTTTKIDREVEALAVASIDALHNIGVSIDDAIKKVRAVAGAEITIDLRKKIKSKKSEKYKAHRVPYDAAQRRFTLGLVDRGLPPVTEKTILDNLALNVLLLKGQLPMVHPTA